MNTINWNSYTLAELLKAVDNGQDVPVAALALAARSVLDELDDANNTIRILEDDAETHRAELHRANTAIESVRAMLEELQEELS